MVSAPVIQSSYRLTVPGAFAWQMFQVGTACAHRTSLGRLLPHAPPTAMYLLRWRADLWLPAEPCPLPGVTALSPSSSLATPVHSMHWEQAQMCIEAQRQLRNENRQELVRKRLRCIAVASWLVHAEMHCIVSAQKKSVAKEKSSRLLAIITRASYAAAQSTVPDLCAMSAQLTPWNAFNTSDANLAGFRWIYDCSSNLISRPQHLQRCFGQMTAPRQREVQQDYGSFTLAILARASQLCHHLMEHS